MAGGSTAAPFGSFDTPADGATGVSSNIPVTGWALDDIGIDKVQILRDAVGAEAAGTRVYIGDAVFVDDSRPDVGTAYPNAPASYRGGWGYMMLTNFLPAPSGGTAGNGVYKLYAVATDKDGHQTTLGAKTITVDNAHAVKPFGTLDTPAQGATISGTSYVNFGWALTPQPSLIPTNGSTIKVIIDGINQGNPTYNQSRADIIALFPGYANTSGAVGYFRINTTLFANGMHSISWVVSDNAGHADGLGSRYFFVLNTTSGAQPALTSDPGVPRSRAEAWLGHPAVLSYRRGVDTAEPLAPVPGESGAYAPLELDRS